MSRCVHEGESGRVARVLMTTIALTTTNTVIMTSPVRSRLGIAIKALGALLILAGAAWWYLGAPGWPHDEHWAERVEQDVVRGVVESQVNNGRPLIYRSNKRREVGGVVYVCGEYYLRADGDTAGPRAGYAGTLSDILVEAALPDSARERYQQAWTHCNARP